MSKTSNDYDWMIKVIIIGDSAVGKTNMLLRTCDNKFVPNHLSTIGVDFKMKLIDIDNKKLKMQLWDTAGQERYKTINNIYYKGAMGIILTYAINDRNSFNNISNWLTQIRENSSDEVCLILAGNKSDLNDRQVEFTEGKSLADSLKVPFFECSAKDGKNIEELFLTIAKNIMAQINVGEGGKVKKDKFEFTNLDDKKDNQTTGSRCGSC